MRTLRKGGIFLVLVVFVLLATQATGAQDAEAPAPETPTVEEIFAQVSETLAGVQSLKIQGQVSARMPGQQQFPPQRIPVTYVFAPGPKIALQTPFVEMYLDDAKVISYIPMVNQYQVQEVPVLDSEEQTPDEEALREFVHSTGDLEQLVEQGRDALEALKDATTVSGQETVEGQEGWVVEGTFRLPLPETDGVLLPFSIWHRKSNGLPIRVSVDWDALMRHIMDQMPQGQAPSIPAEMRTVLTFSRIDLDPDLPEDTFTFEPPAGARQVQGFGPGAGGGPQPSELSGKPAPGFTAETLDGEEITLSELKGKAVVLDFWASWCGPCMMELPHIQEFWTEVKDRDVVVLGINGDSDESDARGAVGDKGLTFPIVHDRDDAISDAYAVSAIPCLVLIGPDGKVIGRHVGFDPDIKEVLRKDVEQALKDDEEEPAATGEAEPAAPEDAETAPSSVE
ncbi:MAG: redoxin domain-containing protein [Candidatus Brocadiia bacterium]